MLHTIRLAFSFLAIFGLLLNPSAATNPAFAYLSHPMHSTKTALAAVSFDQIVTGGNFTCALDAAGEVQCWGFNNDGQLGNGTNTSSSLPVTVAGLPGGMLQLEAGWDYACVVTGVGGVKCWGANYFGQLGDGTTDNHNTPVDVAGLSGAVTALSAGGGQTCALLAGGSLQCWGYNQFGQLGDGTTENRRAPVNVVGLDGSVSALSAGNVHTCAILVGGGMKCWGNNTSGQLGDGSLQDRPLPVDVIGLGGSASALGAGGYHTCALLSSGAARCWGENYTGTLGNGNYTDSSVPVDVFGLAGGASSLAVGYSHTCVLAAGGLVKCWGDNSYGKLGDGSTTTSNIPQNVIGLFGSITSLSAGGDHTCALTGTGQVRCWGWSGFGQAGDGAIILRSVPLEVLGLAGGALKLAAGNSHTCAVGASGEVKCWGDNGWGQLGDGTNRRNSGIPVNVIGLTGGVSAISAGESHTCALTASGGVKCWGANNSGQLGDGTNQNRSTPVDVTGLASGVIAIAAGGGHTCALTTAGAAKCWGSNGQGELGDGTSGNYRLTPVDVVGLSNGVTSIAAWFSTCAVLAGGRAQCWGFEGHTTPFDIPGLESGVSSISLGWYHACALTATGAKCWGDNEHGELGCGDVGCGLAGGLVNVVGLPGGVTTLAAIGQHTCVLTASGAMWCWGRNGDGELGDGTTENRLAPVQVSGMASGVSALSGTHHTCAIAAGRVKCWGADVFGQLGQAVFGYHLVPVEVVSGAGENLRLSHPNGQPGSFLTLTGWNLPASSSISLTLNGTALTPAIAVNPTGSFIVFLDTAGADPGYYDLRVQSAPRASVGFNLDAGASLRLQEGGGLTLQVPPGLGKIAFSIFLPSVSTLKR
jgi:alpha-tubulin suppressor-like RCC1 family protein